MGQIQEIKKKRRGRVRGTNVSKSKNWFPICNNTHLSQAFDVFSPKGGRGKRESSFSPFTLSPPRLTSLFFVPQKRLILRIERQSQKRSGEEKGTQYLLLFPQPAPTKEAKNRWANTAYVLYPKFEWDVMVREKPHFGPNPPLWTVLYPVSMGMAKKEIYNTTREYRNIIFYLLDLIKNFKQLFCFSQMRLSQFFEPISIFFSISSFFICLSFYSQFCSPFYRLSFSRCFGCLSFQQREKFNL